MTRKTRMMSFLPSLLALITSATIAAAELPANMALPGCPSACNKVTIPYPFGIGHGCFRDGFEITCDSRNHSNIKPSLSSTGVEVLSLSLQPGEARVQLPVAWDCYNKSGSVDHYSADVNFNPSGVYRLSDSHNQFVVIGCNSVAWIQSHEDINGDYPYDYYTGCLSYCNNKKSVVNGSCTGIGCCQVAIPGNLTDNSVGFGGYTHKDILDFSPCSYAFLVDKDWFRFGLANLTMELNTTVPVWLDWAIRGSNLACKEANRDAGAYACRSQNSECYDSINGPGYLCNCSQGYQGNPYLDDGCKDIDECRDLEKYPCHGVCHNTPGSYECTCPIGEHGEPLIGPCMPNSRYVVKVAIGSVASFVLLLVVIFFMLMIYQRRRLQREREIFFQKNGGLILYEQIVSKKVDTMKIYTKEDLESITNNYSIELGRGGRGKVYKGILEDNRPVAIKKSIVIDESQKKEFVNEMIILSQINHKNVVRLLGCCLEIDVPMLVYEFVSNGTLYDFLHGSNRSPIPLERRLRIAVETAEALAYLHSSTAHSILHGDVKSANILLDDRYMAKVSDFGTSKLLTSDVTQLATLIQGTRGYLDPEFMQSGRITDKSDVFSFGVVLLELITRKKAVLNDGSELRSLAQSFVLAMREERLGDILDDEIAEEEDMQTLGEVAELALQCLRLNGEDRPAMKEVAEHIQMFRKYRQQQQDQGHLESEENFVDCSTEFYTMDVSRFYSSDETVMLDIESAR